MPIDNVKPEQKLNSEPKPINTTSSPDIGNTDVVGSQCHGTSIESVPEIIPNKYYNQVGELVKDKRMVKKHLSLLGKKANINIIEG